MKAVPIGTSGADELPIRVIGVAASPLDSKVYEDHPKNTVSFTSSLIPSRGAPGTVRAAGSSHTDFAAAQETALATRPITIPRKASWYRMEHQGRLRSNTAAGLALQDIQPVRTVSAFGHGVSKTALPVGGP